MILLTTEEIIRLHEKLIASIGGLAGLRDKGLLESAVFGVNASYDDEEAYKTIPEKAARFAFSLIKNHPFIDGNKRIGILTMLMTLRLNHFSVKYSQSELIALGFGIADSKVDYDGTLAWINNHMSE